MLKSIAHTAVVTADMKRAREFYEKTLGLRVVADFVLDDRGVDEIVQLKNTRLHIVMCRAPEDENGPLIELTHYQTPQGEPLPEDFRCNNVGCSHICFWVDDVDAEYQRLKAMDVVFNSEPRQIDAGELGVVKAAYFRDPDGVTLELLQLLS